MFSKNKKIDKLLTLYVPLGMLLSFTLFPLYWTINTAFKPEGDIMKRPLEYAPLNPTVENFVMAWNNVGFATFMKNSLIVGVSTVIVVLICSTLSGYALARYQFKGKRAFMLMLLCTQFIPRSMMIIPLFIIFKNLGLISSPLALIITYTAIEIPFTTILMSGFIANVPKELEEAAMIDGCTKLQSIRHVVFPLLLPGIVATGVFTFIYTWNEFLIALMLTNRQDRFTLPVGLSTMMGEFNVNYGALAAGSVIALIPAVILFAYAQKHLVNGMGGAVKG
ncbi:carbohydrate ABC transporter permease [Solibacillus sp. FSL K6-1781]|uniref:ABC-type sugar transport system, permease component n=2 Tax=Solibacillus TaxID=648800 RepID=F2F0Z7_SOLSS|nr:MULTISPECIES: carbohydrate ABC transporter permease [Solibacillus]AMO85310.1 transporter [Solibacillus silvestris]EKB44036.1 Inner membrane ABC transporter permease protein ycjP [Solibacillus isronensis B3W22]MCM3721556.1 carbohydrate ABC transporter permease [Solibacillus isronensis]OBW59367.1 transporter [Solibacillus silvestris]BAK16792.1 ABC-type sugar transport system, permease component [Solibacillus silvestris StLB046]